MKVVKQLFSSKKFTVGLAGVLFVVLNEVLGLGVGEDLVGDVVQLASAFLVGQGIADAGKEKAKIEAGAK